MMLATDTSNQEDLDPSLNNLVPAPAGKTRSTLLATVVALVLVSTIWVSPTLFRPNVLDTQTGAIGGNLERHGQVFTIVKLHNQGRTSVTVDSVEAIPGASVTSAWLIDVPLEFAGPRRDDYESEQEHMAAYQAYLEANSIVYETEEDPPKTPSDYPSGMAWVSAEYPEIDDAKKLPQTVQRGQRAWLITLWDLENCDLLVPDDLPDIALRTSFGLSFSPKVTSQTDLLWHPAPADFTDIDVSSSNPVDPTSCLEPQ